MLDDLGPGFHFALFDSEPVIAVGSRSILGLGWQFGRLNDEMFIPMLIAFLTRPCALAIELRRTDRVLAFLQAGRLFELLPAASRWMQPTYYRLDGKDAWVIGLDVMGIGVRLRVEIKDRYLLVSNMPWRPALDVTGVTRAVANGGVLQASPRNVKAELAALFSCAMEGARANVHESLAYLAPFTLLGMTPEEAMREHARRFGFAPRLPDGLSATQLASLPGCDGFGSLADPHQPDVGDGPERFGVLQDLNDIEVAFEFEDTGLRSIVRWTLRDVGAE